MEFGGPIGTMLLTAVLPAVVYSLYYLCPPGEVFTLNDIRDIGTNLTSHGQTCFANPTACLPSLKLDAMVVVIGWIAFQGLLERILPGKVKSGTTLITGGQLQYKLNGLVACATSFLVLFYGNITWNADKKILESGRFELEWIYDNFFELITATVAFSFVLSALLYIFSFRENAELARHGNTGYIFYDFFMGRELNPRVPGTTFDLKFFCELRPGLIGWMVINVAFALKELESNGSIQPAMYLINAFQGLYVVDALIYEPAVLTTMDITTDGFGFMLAFGDLVWVPFTYSLQARYLVTHPGLQSTEWLTTITVLNLLGYVIFRRSNSEKDLFRRDPNSPAVSHLKYMKTARGSRLLISGWWGMARKINYTGDWLMGLAWCLVTGFDSFVTYFYAIYFAVLLVHRAARDNEMCSKKYGNDWEKYKEHVPEVFIPGIF